MLATEQISQFEQEGYLVLKGLFSPAEVTALKQAIAELLEPITRQDRPPDTGFDPWFHGRDRGGDALNPNRVVYMNDLHLQHPRLNAHMRSEKLCTVFCDLWQADINAFQAATVLKPNQYDAEYHGWHQDMPDYVPLSNDRNACVITYLCEMGPQNGGTSFVPGSHKNGLPERTYETIEGWPEKLKKRSIAGFDESSADIISPDFQPGDAFVFHSSLYHRANSNASNETKIGLINVYQAQDCIDLESRNHFKAADLPLTNNRRPIPF